MWTESVQGEKKVKTNRLDLLSKFAIVVCVSLSSWIKSDSQHKDTRINHTASILGSLMLLRDCRL
jgi:hypothetical protein